MKKSVEHACSKIVPAIERTKHLQEVWCNDVPDTPNVTLGKLLNSHHQIEEELSELTDIIGEITNLEYTEDSDRCIEKVSDVAVDLIEYINQMLVNCGLVDRFNTDSYKIYENNLTKTCDTFEDAVKTVAMYQEKGVECFIDSHPLGWYVVKRLSDNKVMKPWDFVSVEL